MTEEASMNSWLKSNPLLESFQTGLPVRLIGTPRTQLTTCEAAEPVAVVVERNRDSNYDFLPVTGQEKSGRPSIIGLLGVAPFMAGEIPPGSVRESMHHLSEPYLVGADSSIIAFIRRADESPCRLVVSGDEISGLVCLYDIQKLPARAAIFAMVSALETVMAEVVRKEFPEDEQWLALLTEKRRNDLVCRMRMARAADSFVDALLMTEFGDKETILRKVSLPTSNGKLRKEMEQIQNLRNALAHANEYASTREQARRSCETVRLMDQWLEILGALMVAPV